MEGAHFRSHILLIAATGKLWTDYRARWPNGERDGCRRTGRGVDAEAPAGVRFSAGWVGIGPWTSVGAPPAKDLDRGAHRGERGSIEGGREHLSRTSSIFSLPSPARIRG